MARSFDLFDTLITRAVAAPTDVHRIVGEALGVEGYLAQRVAAEKSAYQRYGWRATLKNIIDELGLANEVACRAEALELEVERRLACPIADVGERFTAGDVVVSDMYLPAAFLDEVLRQLHPGIKPAAMIVSNVHGKSKLHGDIWPVVRAECPSVTTHIGDHPIADRQMPERAGLHTELITAARLNRPESRLAAAGLAGSLCAGAAKAARLGTKRTPSGGVETDTLTDVFAGTFAPLFVAFSQWVIEEAERRGIRTLYFLARDGQIPLEVCRRLVAARGSGPECRYLYVSRSAVNLAGAADAADATRWITDNEKDLSVGEAASRAMIDGATLLEALRRHGLSRGLGDRLSLVEVRLLRDALLEDPVASMISAASRDAHAVAAHYLVGEGLRSDGPVGVVDIGWKGNMQRAIRSILEKAGYAPDITGFYLHLDNAEGRLGEGEYSSFLTAHSGAGSVNIAAYRQVLEAVFSADHSRTIGYEMLDGRASPVFGAAVPASRAEQIRAQHGIVGRFVERLVESQKLLGSPIEVPRGAVVQNLIEFLQKPSAREARAFAGYMFDGGGSDGTGVRSLCTEASLWRLLSSKESHGFWVEGTFAASGYPLLYEARRWLGVAVRPLRRMLGSA
jgi:hypothetical protein